MGKTCKGSVKLGTGCGSCSKCKKEKRDSIYLQMISDIEKMMGGLESINHPDFAAIRHLRDAKLSIEKSQKFEFGKGENYYLENIDNGTCSYSGNTCVSSFFENAPACMGCKGYFIRKNIRNE